ncbi:tyrosine-type recombinase/integrase [Methylocystis rosea]|uniref:tyrosine-type recombinase/integrase n=1 Tax=Methylocystis rosea TaxID=173366 RepID=UPI00036E6333|nr:tyrosine-type recombinase/integrase [Methylocystis rosea]
MPRLTKTVVDALDPAGKNSFVWDSDLSGFGVRLMASGRMTYVVQYRTAAGATRRLTLASVGAIAPDEARKVARLRLADVAHGRDPSEERRAAREASRPMTVAELCEQYLQAARHGHVTTRFGRSKRAATVAIDEGRVSRHIVPLIGKKPAGELTRADIQRMADAIAAGKTATHVRTRARGVARVTGGPGTAARVVELLGGVWTWAEKRGLVSGQNPARGVDKARGEAQERVLSIHELGALGEAMERAREAAPLAVGALRLIALTGLRRDEACGLRWSEVDFEGSCLRLAQTKTGRSTRAIGKAAIEHLRSLPRLSDEFVFPSRSGKTYADLKKQLAAIFDAAKLTDARSQALRRTFATSADEAGYGDATVGELLGHAKRGVTQRSYVRRPDAALVAAATRVAQTIANAIDRTGGKVVALHPLGIATDG